MPTKNPPSAFTEAVLAVVRAIKPGKTMSYGEVAARAGSPKAARAVGSIMAANYREDVPCHRVIKADGSLGAYNRGGPKAKKALLIAEGVNF